MSNVTLKWVCCLYLDVVLDRQYDSCNEFSFSPLLGKVHLYVRSFVTNVHIIATDKQDGMAEFRFFYGRPLINAIERSEVWPERDDPIDKITLHAENTLPRTINVNVPEIPIFLDSIETKMIFQVVVKLKARSHMEYVNQLIIYASFMHLRPLSLCLAYTSISVKTWRTP